MADNATALNADPASPKPFTGPQQTVEDLGKLVKKKYPDAYGQLSDIEVGQKVKAKYPQYSQFADAKPKLPIRRGSLTGREPGEDHRTGLQQVGDLVKGTMEGPAALGLGVAGVLGGGEAAIEAGSALLSGSYRPALGLAMGLGTGFAVDKAAKSLGAPPWLADIISGMAGLAVGEKVGASPELIAKLKDKGFSGAIREWLHGPPKPKEAFEFFKEKYGKMPETGAEKLRAQAEASAYKKQVASEIAKAQAGPAPPAPHEPMKPSAGVARKMKFGGLAPESDAGSGSYKRIGMGGAPEPPPKPKAAEPFEPVKPKASIAAKLKAGGAGSYSGGYEGAGRSSYRNPPSSRYQKLKAEDIAGPEAKAYESEAEEAETKAPKAKTLKEKIDEKKSTTAAASVTPKASGWGDAQGQAPEAGSKGISRWQNTETWGSAANDLKNERFAKYFKEKNISPEQVLKLSEQEIDTHGKLLLGNKYRRFKQEGSANQSHRTYKEALRQIALKMKEKSE